MRCGCMEWGTPNGDSESVVCEEHAAPLCEQCGEQPRAVGAPERWCEDCLNGAGIRLCHVCGDWSNKTILDKDGREDICVWCWHAEMEVE